VTIVLFSDFGSPHCARLEPALSDVLRTYAAEVRLVWKSVPPPSHTPSWLAAEAALAAHEQGKFWAFHDRVFANRSKLDPRTLERIARDLGLDMKRFGAALHAHRFKAVIERDAEAAQRLHVRGTPSLFINGARLEGSQPFAVLAARLDEEIARARTLRAALR
jgi:protein-disulfide isomerase